jgi:primase-polymerase (primpol)-like protein
MRCESCGDEFYARRDARYCSSRCRVAAHRASDGPPAELTTRPRWVAHKQKAPRVPFGGFASSTDPTTWRDYATATSAVAAGPRGGNMDGVGFVLNGDGIACIDLDDCLDGDTLAPWAQEIVDRCPRTFIEVSPSGRGLHIWGYAEVGKGRRSGGVEVYDRGRYICVTGRRFAGSSRRLSDISSVVATL